MANRFSRQSSSTNNISSEYIDTETKMADKHLKSNVQFQMIFVEMIFLLLFGFKFQRSLFLWVKSTIRHWFGTEQIVTTKCDTVCWRIYPSLGLKELTTDQNCQLKLILMKVRFTIRFYNSS